MSETQSTTRTFLLFALVAGGSTIASLPLFGLTAGPEAAAPPEQALAKPAEPKAKLAEKEARSDRTAKADDSAARPAAPRPAAPAARRKTRIVWEGGGGSGPPSDARAAAAKPANASAYRLPVNTGAGVQVQPVGGYIATTASGGKRRGGG